MHRVRGGDRGQVVPLVALVVLLAGVALLGLGRVGAVLVAHARARTAADAAALAAATDGVAVAQAVAAANGGVLLDVRREGHEIEVLVRVDPAEARARAAPERARPWPRPNTGP